MEAAYYEIDSTGWAACRLCPHRCHIAQGHRGRCQTRYYDGRNLQALNYGQCTAIALDPIEKKPLYRFHPGSAILSLGSWGCNFTCPFCQNWQISQQEAPFRELTPEQALALARRHGAEIRYDETAQAPWFRYTAAGGREHEVWFEDARSSYAKFRLAAEKGLQGVGLWNLTRPAPQTYLALHGGFEIEVMR